MQAVRFHVEAMLLIDPAPERIAFDTVLEISKGAYSVKEG
jgi:predicted component of type VI protein secretion system